MTLLLTALAAFSVTMLATPAASAGARRLRLLDHPNERSSHERVTPRAGGLALLAGLVVAAILTRHSWLERPEAIAVLLGVVFVTLVGLADDRYSLPPWPRLGAQLGAAAVVVSAAGGFDRLPLPRPLDIPLGGAGLPLAVVWIVGVVNFYNFMDGIDGLASLQGAITAGAFALALAGSEPGGAALAAGVAAVCAAFLVFNWSPASVFLGDAGSGLLGFALASLPLLAPSERRSEAVVLAGASLFLFLADATSCLARRVHNGERWYEAHRTHLYQRWVRAGARHSTVAAWLGLGSLGTTTLALVGWWTRAAPWYWAALLLGTGIVVSETAFVRRLERATAGY